ncbi:hypothetical protein P3X46_013445 [Hevea brasiliensis]|uniref:Uncharacterized protein n=1 Tax=Hevea brasiliensis TaxID=3981 RepID=A0ABQ9M3J2_HEVBR|nr:uncharacterized protein LOC110652384 isoform X3 [Hevea brasiliensis]KAJ9174844.1 hypothetical protein P3X46_013445 [Hevea brasiliensis]
MASLMTKLLVIGLIAAGGSISLSLGAEAEQLTSEEGRKEKFDSLHSKNIHPRRTSNSDHQQFESNLLMAADSSTIDGNLQSSSHQIVDGDFRKIHPARILTDSTSSSSPKDGHGY